MVKLDRFDIITNLQSFINQRTDLIINKEFDKIYLLQNINVLTKYYYELIPNLYWTRSGCEIENCYDIGVIGYSKHDSVRLLSSLITHNFNEVISGLCIGNYYSSIIFLRPILEWELKILACITDLSILTGQKNHKGKIGCFEGLRNLEEFNRLNYKKRKQLKIIKKDLKSSDIDDSDKEFFNLVFATIQSYTQIIKNIDPMIIKYLDIKKVENTTKVLLNLYSDSSEHIHFSIKKLDSLMIGGAKNFHNKKEFDNFFEIIINYFDIILYLYIIIIDLEVHSHCNKDRYSRRMKLKDAFNKFVKTRKYMNSCKNLFKSKEWSSKEGINLI